MKKIKVLGLFMLVVTSSFGQRSTYDTIRVGVATTIHVVFESKIVDYTLGSGELQGMNGTYTEVGLTQAGDNKIKLAANIENFETTNLFVETSTGYFNFILEYTGFPNKQIFSVKDKDATLSKSNIASTSAPGAPNEKVTKLGSEFGQDDKFYQAIKRKAIRPSSIAKKIQGVQYYISGIYTNGTEIGIKLIIENLEGLRYNLSYVNWTIKEKKNLRNKKGSIEYNEPLKPSNSSEFTSTLSKDQQGIYVFVFPKFTLTKTQELIIEIGEKEGSRTCDLRISQSEIIRADYINDK